jgi:hypothetical protein
VTVPSTTATPTDAQACSGQSSGGSSMPPLARGHDKSLPVVSIP